MGSKGKQSENDPIKEKEKTKKSNHPSRDLIARQNGFGIAAGYEKSYNKQTPQATNVQELYAPNPHSGYYGSGVGLRPFKIGQAGFEEEITWYDKQYGEVTGRTPTAKPKV